MAHHHLLIVYHTLTGGSLQMAQAAAEGAQMESGVDVQLLHASQASATAGKFSELRDQPGFAETFLVDGQPPKAGSRFLQPTLANTLRRLT